MALPVTFDTKADYDLHKIQGSYGIREEVLTGLTPTVVCPEIGDLIIGNAWLLHRVNLSGGTRDRVTCSCFGGIESANLPVNVYS